MTIKDLLIQELDNVPDPLMVEVLDFLRFLKTKQTKDSPVFVAARASLTQPSGQPSSQDSSSSQSYPLQSKEPYHYNDPFAPAIPLEDWEVLQ